MRFGIRRYLLAWMAMTAALWLAPPTQAADFHNGLSLQGYTGLLNTPNAAVTDDGYFHFQFSDQVEPERRDRIDSAENYLFSIGLLPYFEFGGRLTEEHPEGMRDLSASAKIRVPRFFDRPYIPDLAFGVQDVGGGSTNLETTYAVASQTLGALRLSLGLGVGPDRLDGIFGGAELRLYEWLYLMGEYDTVDANVGIRLLTPDDLLPMSMKLGMTAKTSVDHDAGDLDLAFMLRFPLGFGRHERERLPAELGPTGDGSAAPEKRTSVALQPVDSGATADFLAAAEEGDVDGSEEDGVNGSGKGDLDGSRKSDLDGSKEGEGEPAEDVPSDSLLVDQGIRAIKEKLVQLGFENVRAGVIRADTLYIEYENNRYNHNELDGLGLTMGVAARMAPESLGMLVVVMKRVQLPMIALEIPIATARDYLLPERIAQPAEARFLNALKIDQENKSYKSVRFVGDLKSSSRYRIRATLYPGLKTFTGTEVGALDYRLSLKADMGMQVWPGGVINAMFDIPLHWTDDFDDGGVFDRHHEDAGLEQIMLHQAFRPTSSLTTQVSVGQYDRDRNGALNETYWYPSNGLHRLGFKLGYFKDQEENADFDVWIASYRYYLQYLDLYAEASYGNYLFQDRGFIAEFKRYFGDTAVSIFYKHVGTDTGERSAGIEISLPLTPRRDMKPGHVQITGSDRWDHDKQTAIASSGQRNPVVTNRTVVPETSQRLAKVYYNDDRLSEQYIRRHISRLRQAHVIWGE